MLIGHAFSQDSVRICIHKYQQINNDTNRYSAVDQCDDRGRAMWTTYAHALSAAAGSQANHCECEPINITISTITAIWSNVAV